MRPSDHLRDAKFVLKRQDSLLISKTKPETSKHKEIFLRLLLIFSPELPMTNLG